MAVLSVGSTYKYFLGLSTDTKPTDAADAAEYRAMDTGEVWTFFDNMWVLNLETAALPRMAALAAV